MRHNRQATPPMRTEPQVLPSLAEPHRMSRRAFLKLAVRGTLAAAVAGVGGVEYVRAVEPAWVTVQPVRLTLPRLAAAFHGYRIAQISDIHMGDWMTRERLA